jgi:hypothetical protein
MSEVDRLSNSGLYPALPIADRERGQGDPSGKPPPDPRGNKPDSKTADRADAPTPRPPKSIIDEYA